MTYIQGNRKIAADLHSHVLGLIAAIRNHPGSLWHRVFGVAGFFYHYYY
jgi:hypothetical protein